MKNEILIQNKSYFFILVPVILILFHCNSEQHWGFLTNTNDGVGTISGKSLDFYFNGDFVYTVASGTTKECTISKGQHIISILLSETDSLLVVDTFNIEGDGWTYGFGCSLGGTYPITISMLTKESK